MDSRANSVLRIVAVYLGLGVVDLAVTLAIYAVAVTTEVPSVRVEDSIVAYATSSPWALAFCSLELAGLAVQGAVLLWAVLDRREMKYAILWLAFGIVGTVAQGLAYASHYAFTAYLSRGPIETLARYQEAAAVAEASHWQLARVFALVLLVAAFVQAIWKPREVVRSVPDALPLNV